MIAGEIHVADTDEVAAATRHVADALRGGRLSGAGLDVIDGEWDDDLASRALIAYARENQNLVITPHIGGVTFESQRATIEHTIQKLKRYAEEVQ